MLGTKHGQTGAVLVQGGTDPAPTPREPGHAPNANPNRCGGRSRALTGAVLVVNAAWTSSSALLRSPAADAAERCRSAAAAGLSIWLQG